MLEVNGLGKSFGETAAVVDLSFKVEAGEIYGLLGPNGAGKTTTISMICGLLDPDGGRITIDGKSLRDDPRTVKAVMGYVPQEIALYEELSALENVRFWGGLYGMSGGELDRRAREVLEKVGLAGRARDAIASYSGGMKRRINLAVALLHRPRLLLLDEPTAGIDPQARLSILDIVREIAAAGAAVLYTTHYMEEAENLCHRIGIMDQGRLLAEGTLEELVSMLGEGRIVSLSGPFTAARVEGPLRRQEDLTVLALEAGRCLFVSKDPERITAVMKSMFEEEVPVEDISVRDPSLESLFIKLTGKELRD